MQYEFDSSVSPTNTNSPQKIINKDEVLTPLKKKKVEYSVSQILKPYLREQLFQFLFKKTSPTKKTEPAMQSIKLLPPVQMSPTKQENHHMKQLSLGESPRNLPQRFNFSDVKKNHSDNDTWIEIHSSGQLMLPRAYHTSVGFKESTFYYRIFIYGGRDNNKGSFGDLTQLKFNDQGQYCMKILQTAGSSPSYLSRHTAILYNNIMIIYGGSLSPSVCSNKIFSLDLNKFIWAKISPEGETPLSIDDHTSVLFNGKMVVFGGYCPQPDCEYTNALQIFDPETNYWKIFREKKSPLPRANHSAIVFQDAMWIFAGINQSIKFNDLFKWDFKNGWTQVFFEGTSPEVKQKLMILFFKPRYGHIMFADDKRIFVFGGSKGLLNELNELWKFDGQEWICLEQNNIIRKLEPTNSLLKQKSRRASQNLEDDENFSVRSSEKSFNIRKNKTVEKYLIQFPRQKEYQTLNGSNNNTQQEFQSKEQPNIDIKTSRQLVLEKRKLLSTFAFKKDEDKRYIVSTPVTTQLKQSIQAVENPGLKNNNNRENNLVLNTQRILRYQISRPLPRDGATMTKLKNGWYLICGDRHKVTFSDVWFIANEQLEKFK